MNFSVSFFVPPGPDSERAAAAHAGFRPALDAHPDNSSALQVLHNLAAAASAAVRTMDPAQPVCVRAGVMAGGCFLRVGVAS